MCEQTRQQASAAPARHSRDLGADGVAGAGYDAPEIGQHATEVLCCGTAVVLERTEG